MVAVHCDTKPNTSCCAGFQLGLNFHHRLCASSVNFPYFHLVESALGYIVAASATPLPSPRIYKHLVRVDIVNLDAS